MFQIVLAIQVLILKNDHISYLTLQCRLNLGICDLGIEIIILMIIKMSWVALEASASNFTVIVNRFSY